MPFPHPKDFRKKSNWGMALGVEALGPALRAWARARTGPATHPREWRRALILGANHLGDVLYRTGSLAALKAGLPECEFHYLTAPGTAPLLEGNPALAGVLPWDRADAPLHLESPHLDALRAMRFDAVLCTNSSMYWRQLRFAIRLGVPNRAGCVDKGFSAWVTFPIPVRRPQPFAAYFRDFVAALTGRVGDWPLRPVIYTNETDQAEADALWLKLGLDRQPRVTACFMTSRQPSGIWPAAKFGEALRALRQRAKTHIILCGAAADEPLLATVDRDYGLGADMAAGALGIRALCCFLRRCAVVLTSDSGPRHIANAAGVPVVFVRNVLFNATEAGVYAGTETDLCPPPHDGDRGDGAALLAAIDPGRAAGVTAEFLTAN